MSQEQETEIEELKEELAVAVAVAVAKETESKTEDKVLELTTHVIYEEDTESAHAVLVREILEDNAKRGKKS